jgi:hypothetical protein
MKFLNKKIVFATAYKKWVDDLENKKTNHPVYNSSNGKYYYDIVANLLWIQEGLCAYTERRLQNHLPFHKTKWKKGKYKKFEFAGQLDHYDNSLKKEKGWLWENFFLIDSDINVKLKRDKTPLGVLKPDLITFNPFDLLQYEITTHIFIPNSSLNFTDQIKVLKEINLLGLNFQPIIDIRREYLSPIIEDVKYHKKTFDKALSELNQFFTAFLMAKEYMDN